MKSFLKTLYYHSKDFFRQKWVKGMMLKLMKQSIHSIIGKKN